MTDQDPIIPGANIIDSRDIIARIFYLEMDEASLRYVEESELEKLRDLASQCESYGDCQYGENLILDSYFAQYTSELIDDTYGREINTKRTDWPFRHLKLDIAAAAKELQDDYMAVDFDGTPYWMRA